MTSAQHPSAELQPTGTSTDSSTIWHEQYKQPWPLCWEMMQWQISQTLWRRHRHLATLTVEVVWSEWLLKNHVDPDTFRLACIDYHQVLKQQLGERLIWRFEQAPQRNHLVRIEQA